ncbi:MAG: hypothetical protein CMK92_04540 [Pseudomonas sp.]|nr:hypothetical protein [Pseudomonas sp.]
MKPEEYITKPRNNTDFMKMLERRLVELSEATTDSKSFLRKHQTIAKHLITRLLHSRGLLAIHGLGTGKSILLAAIANWFRENWSDWRVVVIMAKSLEANAKKGMAEYIAGRQANAKNEDPDAKFADEAVDPDMDPALAGLAYSYVSMNASNMFQQVLRAAKTAEQMSLEKRLGKVLEAEKPFEKVIYIVDEAQKLFTGISNGSSNAVRFYDGVMHARKVKCLFLSATPMTKGPFELVPCFNMLSGYERTPNGEKHALFPESQEIFEKYFVEYEEAEPVVEEKSPYDEKPDEDSYVVSERTASTAEVKAVGGAATAAKEKTAKKSFTDQIAERATQIKNKDKKSVTAKKKVAAAAKKQAGTPVIDADLKKKANAKIPESTGDVRIAHIMNEGKFGNRISGLVSYYGSLYFEGHNPDFPESKPAVVERVPMSQPQYAAYVSARLKEMQEGLSATGTKLQGRKSAGRGFSKGQGSFSTYRTESRLTSFFLLPEHAYGPPEGPKKKRAKLVGKLTAKDFEDRNPLMQKLLSNIASHGTEPGLVFNPFVQGEGIAVIARALECVRGYKPYKSTLSASSVDKLEVIEISEAESLGSDDRNASVTLLGDVGENDNPVAAKYSRGSGGVTYDSKGIIKKAPMPKGALKYAIISGEVPLEERKELVEIMSSPENANGALIHLLLISKSGAEGLDCKRIRHQHYTAPGFDKIQELQFFGRGVRYKSHVDLPLSQRNVTNYIYLADAPADLARTTEGSTLESHTTHVWMYLRGNAKYDLIQEFTRVLMRYSADCTAHQDLLPEGEKCATCNPSNSQLFHPNLEQDMRTENPCEKHTGVDKTTLTEFQGPDGVTYAYNDDNQIYEFKLDIGIWRKIGAEHPLYDELVETIAGDALSEISKIFGLV